MNKILFGIITGVIAGIIDVIPMIVQKLPWEADASAFSMWVVIGFFISTSSLKLNGIVKGILISILSLIPAAFIIAGKGPLSLVPIAVITIILGGLSGLVIEKYKGRKS